MRPLISQRSTLFTESVIREMTRLCQRHQGVNLAQGFPDFPAPEAIKEEAARAVRADVNQYAITWGAKRLRDALVAKTQRYTGLAFDPGVSGVAGSTLAGEGVGTASLSDIDRSTARASHSPVCTSTAAMSITLVPVGPVRSNAFAAFNGNHERPVCKSRSG